MSCSLLRLWKNDTDLSELLQFVSELPGGMRLALVRNTLLVLPSCVINNKLLPKKVTFSAFVTRENA